MQHHINQTLDRTKIGTTSQLVFKCSKMEIRRRKIGIKYENYQKTKMRREILVPSFRPHSIQSNLKPYKKSMLILQKVETEIIPRDCIALKKACLTEILYFDSVNAFKILQNKDRRERKIGREGSEDGKNKGI